MKTLPNDICRCNGDGCYERNNCLRFTAPRPEYAPTADFEVALRPGKKCRYKIEDKPND